MAAADPTHNADYVAGETVGELVERLGERQAYMHIVAESIKLRMVLSHIIELHPDRNGYCNTCGGNWPCLTRRAASEALHIDGGGGS